MAGRSTRPKRATVPDVDPCRGRWPRRGWSRDERVTDTASTQTLVKACLGYAVGRAVRTHEATPDPLVTRCGMRRWTVCARVDDDGDGRRGRLTRSNVRRLQEIAPGNTPISI
jgi:hypothetical protein